ncbi:MAG: hypothetical protein KAT15_27650, partial [Bacteroidales bacterium]|nr:hypothetical protein [Bacteroidales bacterium]
MASANQNMGLAVCRGCSIGECLDVEKLIGVASEEVENLSCIQHPALCSEAGLQEIHNLITEQGTSRLAIAACSPRVKSEQFRMDNLYVDRINLREQVVWVMDPEDEDTQMCAEDQVRMVLAKLDSISNINPYVPETVSSDILVVGGGVTGLTAALEGAAAGYRVHL